MRHECNWLGGNTTTKTTKHALLLKITTIPLKQPLWLHDNNESICYKSGISYKVGLGYY